MLVPMPLHRRRLWQRQFNQAALLATAMARPSGLAVDSGLLLRIKATTQQVGMSRTQRALNVQGAFKVPPLAEVGPRPAGRVAVGRPPGAPPTAAAGGGGGAGAARVDLAVFALVAGEAALII